jgi:hypothetical protein
VTNLAVVVIVLILLNAGEKVRDPFEANDTSAILYGDDLVEV